MKRMIYIGKENGQETVMEDNGSLATDPRYIVPYPIPSNWKVGESVEVELHAQFMLRGTSEWIDTNKAHDQLLKQRIVAKPISITIPAEGITEHLGIVTDSHPNGQHDFNGAVSLPVTEDLCTSSNAIKTNCPTCGSVVLQVSGEEGTGYFAPIKREEQPTVTAEGIRNAALDFVEDKQRDSQENRTNIHLTEDVIVNWLVDFCVQCRSLPGLKQIASDAWEASDKKYESWLDFGKGRITIGEYNNVPDKETYLKQFNK